MLLSGCLIVSSKCACFWCFYFLFRVLAVQLASQVYYMEVGKEAMDQTPATKRFVLVYPTSKVSPAIPLTLCSAHITIEPLEKAVLLSRAAVPSPIEKSLHTIR